MHFGIKGMKWKKHKAKSPSEILRDAKKRAAQLKNKLKSMLSKKPRYKSQPNSSSLRRAERAAANKQRPQMGKRVIDNKSTRAYTSRAKAKQPSKAEQAARKYGEIAAREGSKAARKAAKAGSKAAKKAAKSVDNYFRSGKAKSDFNKAKKTAGSAAKKTSKASKEAWEYLNRNSGKKPKSRPGPGTPGSSPNTGSMDPKLKKQVDKWTKTKGPKVPKDTYSKGNEEISNYAKDKYNKAKKFFSYKRKVGNRKTNRRNSGKGTQK